MSDHNNIFSEIINYEPAQEIVVGTSENTTAVEFKSELQEDFEQARINLKELADISQEATLEFARMAKQMQDPRSYGTLSKMVTAAMMAQKAVVELHRNKQEGRDPNELPVPTTINQTLILTTDELQRKMEEAQQSRIDREAAEALAKSNG